MKIVALIIPLFVLGYSFGQNSYYFSDPLPSSNNKITDVDSRWYGIYSNGDSPISYEFTKEGVFVVSTLINSMSKEFIRESSKYKVKKGFIFGITEHDSIPCVLKDGRYYFGVKNREQVVGGSTQNVLTRISDGNYVLNYFEAGNYVPTTIEFKNKSLTIKEFDYDLETSDFGFISSQRKEQNQQQTLVILSPNTQEFQQLRNGQHFALNGSFTKAQ